MHHEVSNTGPSTSTFEGGSDTLYRPAILVGENEFVRDTSHLAGAGLAPEKFLEDRENPESELLTYFL